MVNRIKSIFELESGEMKESRAFIIISLIIVYIAAVIMQNTDKLYGRETMTFTVVMILHLMLYLVFESVFRNKYWVYFGVQGLIILCCVIIMPLGYQAIFLGLIPLLVCQSIIVFANNIKIIITSLFLYSIFFGTSFVFHGLKGTILAVPTIILITIGIRAYSIIFFRQVKLRIDTQKVLQELELAYEKVEELTLANERQRMARDLHDTLSQGLAGIIMQLDAVNANLNNNNSKRAQEIVQKAMEHARKTLSDARHVIDDLRLQVDSDIDCEKIIENEITKFKAVSHTSITADIRIESKIPIHLLKHTLYIVREGLSNIAKHSGAGNAVVEIIEEGEQLYINIADDGVGFDVKLLEQLFGHYGILGMTERVKAVNGKLKVKSKRKSGTSIKIIIPIGKGINKEDE